MTKKDRNWLSSIFDKVLKAPGAEEAAPADPVGLAAPLSGMRDKVAAAVDRFASERGLAEGRTSGLETSSTAPQDDAAETSKGHPGSPQAHDIDATMGTAPSGPSKSVAHEESSAQSADAGVEAAMPAESVHAGDDGVETASEARAAADVAPGERDGGESSGAGQDEVQLHDLLDEIRKDSVWARLFDHDSVPLSETGLFAHALDRVGDLSILRLSDGDPNAFSHYTTGGYGIRVSDEAETAASGNPITIKVVARSALATGTRFACAYATNEVGNSGWLWLPAGPRWASYEFHYDVPAMIEGHGDFLGLLPAPAGEPAIEIAGVAVSIDDAARDTEGLHA